MFTKAFVVSAALLASSVVAVPYEGSAFEMVLSSYNENTVVAVAPAPFIAGESNGIESSLNVDSGVAQNAAEYLANAYLDIHNQARSHHGARPMVWDNGLAAKAQNWANKCQFKHSGAGENLAAGTGNYGPAAAIKGWMDEMSQYDPNHPQPSHFTQVVWKSSTHLGCAVHTCPPGSIFPPKFGNAYYHVCEYSPAGNFIGRFPENVQK